MRVAVVGKTISHYRILAKLGEGGMGIVYKAEDENLHRAVALKFLRADAIEDRQSRGRFSKEAEAAAALDHPNITTVYEIGEADGQTFIAMALIEGTSLAAKIKQRPLPLDEALNIGIQVATALQAAHEKGIAHRDIKPGNIMIAAKDQVKVMDFGLAHLAGQTRITKTGTIMGTPAYMSPEQARGEEVDHRSDIWSLGVVLYEMVSGELPFQGDAEQAVLHSILNDEPEPLTALRSGLPLQLDWIVAKALGKEPADRYQHVDDMGVDLRGLRGGRETRTATLAGAALGTPQPHPGTEVKRPKRLLRYATAGAGALFMFAVGAILALTLRGPEPAPEPQLRKLILTPGIAISNPVISPNGQHIAYIAAAGEGDGKLWVQDFDTTEPREIEGAEAAWSPFWSPDSDFIGFGSGQDVKKAPVRGGPAVLVGRMPSALVLHGTWSPDGESIVVGAWTGEPGTLYEVPARGGTPSLLIEPKESDKALRFMHPHFLSSRQGRRLLLYSLESQFVLHDLDEGEQKVLGTGTRPVYAASGHVLYEYESRIWALPFSIEKLQPVGEAVSITPSGQRPSVAADGTLVYLDGAGKNEWQLVLRNRRGEMVGTIGQPQTHIRFPALSPDGRRVAVRGTQDGNPDIWIHEVARAIKSRLTTHPALEALPIWSPSGDQIAFVSFRAGNSDILVKSADGSGEATALVASDLSDVATDWSRDGNHILYERIDSETGRDIWYLRRKDDGSGFEPSPFVRTPFRETAGSFSPDGRFVAYASDESGAYEVYVQPFPEGGGKVRVSLSGGTQPRWSKDGRELFYVQGDSLIAVAVSTSPNIAAESPKRLFRSPGLRSIDFAHYDVTADGQRFIIPEPVEPEVLPVIRVVQNWYEEFRERH